MEGSSNSIGSGSGSAASVAKSGLRHGSSSKAKSFTSTTARSGTSAGAAEAFLGDTAGPISAHRQPPPPPPSQLTTSGADAEIPHVVLGSQGVAGGSAGTSLITPVASDAPAPVRSGMYPSSRRQGGAAASVGARSAPPRAGPSSTVMPASYSGGEDANGESSASNTGYYCNRYHSSDQAGYFSSGTHGYNHNKGEHPGGGVSSGSTSVPYASNPGPMTGSTSSGAGVSDGQSLPVYSFPYQPSVSATTNPQQPLNQHPTQYQQLQRQQSQQQQQFPYAPQQQLLYNPQMSTMEQGSGAYQNYYQQTYQPQQQPQPRLQQFQTTASTSQSLGGESQYYGYYYGSTSGQRRGHARTASSGSGAHYYNSQQQQQRGYPPPSSGEGEVLYNQGSNVQSSSQGGTAESYYQPYAQCPAYSYQGTPSSSQQSQQQPPPQHSPYMCGEGQSSCVSASYGHTIHARSRGSQPCSTTTSAYGGESDAIQGTSAARYAGRAYSEPDNAGNNISGSEGGGVGGRGYGPSTAPTAAGNSGSGIGSGSASGGYYGASYASGYRAPTPRTSLTRAVPYTDGSSDTPSMPLGSASGKGGQTVGSSSYPSLQQGSGPDVEDGSQSYHGYAASGYRDYYVAANQMGISEISPGYAYPAGQASPQQQTIACKPTYACGEAQATPSAAASPLITENHQRGSGGPLQSPQQQYQQGASFYTTDPRYGGGGDSSGGGCDAQGHIRHYPHQQQQQGYYRGHSESSHLQYRADPRPGGASMPIGRNSQYVSQHPETVPRRYDIAEEQGKKDTAERVARTQASDDMAPMPLTRSRGDSRSNSSSHGQGDGGVGSAAPAPSRKRGKKGASSGTDRAQPAATTEGVAEPAQNEQKHGRCGQRSAAGSTTAAPAPAKSAVYQRQASSEKGDAPMPKKALMTREPLVSLELPPSSLNAPNPQPPPLLPHADEDGTIGRSDGVPRDEARSQKTTDRCMPPRGRADAAVHGSGGSSLSGAEDDAEEGTETEYAAETFTNSRCDVATSDMTAILVDRQGAGSTGSGNCRQMQHGSSSTERSAAHAGSASRGSGSASGAQSFLRPSPLTQCLGAPFHTYICGAIVEHAAQLQTNPCSSPTTGGRTEVDADGAVTPPTSLSTTALHVRPTMYAPVQRLLSRETLRGACTSAEERDRGRACLSENDDIDAEGACAHGEEDERYSHGRADAAETAGEGSKDEDAESGIESAHNVDDMKPLTKPLTADALAAATDVSSPADPSLRTVTTLTDGSLRSVGGRPHHLHLHAHHHSHHMRRSMPASGTSSPSVPMPHHCHAYHGTSPFLQPASLAASCTTCLSAGGSAAANKYVQFPESGLGATLPPRLPNGGESSTPHPHRAGGGSREGSGAAATMQQQPSMASYPHYYPHQSSLDGDGGRCAAATEGAPGDTDDHLQHCYQGSKTGSCNNTKSSLRQQQKQQQSTTAEGATSGRRSGPGGASITSSPATVVCGSTFVNTPSQSTLLVSNSSTIRQGSATLSPTTQKHQNQRAANSAVASRLATNLDGGGQHSSSNGPANNLSSTGGSGHRVSSPAHNRYTIPTQPNGYHAGNSQMNLQAGGRYQMPATRPPYIYEHHVGQELLLEEFHAAMRFNAASFGNIACLVDAISPQVPVASDLEFPCNEDQCQLICTRGSRGLSSSPGGGSSQHCSAQGSRSSRGGTYRSLQSEDARTTGGAGHNSTSVGGCGQEGPVPPTLRPAQADRTHYWDFAGPSYCEPVITLKSIWQSFDSPFGCVVNLAEPIYPAPMRPAEGELVYTPLLSGFRIRFHPASPAYKRLTALREVRRQRRREEAAASESAHAPAEDEHTVTGVEGAAHGSCNSHTGGSYAEEDGVLTWSATDRPNNRNIIVEQIVELAKCDESYAELLTATTADVDHQSWVALMWQPVFCGGHSSKHSCGAFLAYYLLRAPRHLFLPFADKSEGAAMNSSWNSPVFRGDRAALSFDLWSLQRHYHVARWASPPPMTHIMTALSVDGEDDEPDNRSSSCASTSRGRNSWEEGQTGCASNRTTESFAFSTNGDSRLRLRDGYAGSTSAAAVVGGESSSTMMAGPFTTPHTTSGATNAAACSTRAKAEAYVRIPVVGLIPNRCRSEVWFKPVYDASLMDVHRHGGGSGSVMGGGEGTGAGASSGVVMGPSNGLGGAGGGGNGAGSNVGDSSDHTGLYAFYAPLFLTVTALQLMCWDAYNEWERKSPTSAAAAGQPSAFSEVRTDAEESEVAIGGAAGAAGTPSSSYTPSPATVEEAGAAAQRQQQQSDYECEATAAAGAGSGNPSRGAAAHCRNPWSSYVAKGVELMADAARQYRSVREVANLDATVEEGSSGCALVLNNGGGSAATANEGCIGSAEERRSGDGDKSVARPQRGGCAVVAGGTSSSLCDPSARVIAGLLDYYQWAQYDTSLTALAVAYCAT